MDIMDRLLFFDTETVGINPNYIISLAYRYYERGKKPVYGMIECNPDYEISEKASEVNGYTYENTKDLPLFVEQWPSIEPMFRDSVWICHNTPFDTRAVRLELKRYCLPEPHHYSLDTLFMSRSILKHKETENHKLITLCKHFNLVTDDDSDKFHAADFDIWATDMVFREFRKMTEDNEYIKDLFEPQEIEGEYTKIEPPCKFCDDYSY